MKKFKSYLINRGLSQTTADLHIRRVRAFLLYCKEHGQDPKTAGYERLLSFVSMLREKQLKPRSLQLYVSSVKLWYASLVKQKALSHHPCLSFKIGNIQKQLLYTLLDQTELDNLYKNYQSQSKIYGQGIRVLLGLLIFQRLGNQEIRHLLCEHIDLENGTVAVPAGKRSNFRILPLRAEQVPALKLQIESQEAKNESKLVVAKNLPSVYQLLLKQLKKGNPKVEGVEQIKASVVVEWLKVHNLREVQYKCGHRYASSTERYLINDIEALQKEIASFHPLG